MDAIKSLLADAARTLLAGRPQEARTLYEACATEMPHLAAFGLAVTAWLQGDFRSLQAHLQTAAAGEAPQGVVWALEGLAAIHAGALGAGLEKQAAGLQEARRLDDGTELNAAVALAEALVILGRWEEAAATIRGLRRLAENEAPMATMLLDRWDLALTVLEGRPEAGPAGAAAVEAARRREDPAGLAWALRWQGAWLAGAEPSAAAAALDEAVELATRCGLHLVAAEALTARAELDAPAERAERLAQARMHAKASGSRLTECDVAAQQGGRHAEEAARQWEAMLIELAPAHRDAFRRWPGRAAEAASPAATAEQLGAMLTSISAQPQLDAVLRAGLAAFVAVAEAERGFLLRLSGLEVIDQVVHGAAPDAYSTSLAGRVIWSGEPLVVEDLALDAQLASAQSVQEMELRMALAVPMLAGGEVVGVMLADSREAHPGFGRDALTLARAIAQHLVVAWQNAEREEQARLEAAAEAALARAGLAAAAAPTLDEALAAIARVAATALGSERLFVCLGPALTCRAALDADGRPLVDAQPSMGAARWVAESGQRLVVVDAQADARLAGRASVRELSLQAIQAAPLPGAEGPLGVLLLDSRTPAPARQQSERLLDGLAALVAAVLAREAR